MTFIYFLAFVYYGYVCIVCVYVLVHMCVHVYVCWEWDKQSSPRKSIPISWSSKWSALKNIHTYTEQDIFSNVFSNVCNCCIKQQLMKKRPRIWKRSNIWESLDGRKRWETEYFYIIISKSQSNNFKKWGSLFITLWTREKCI